MASVQERVMIVLVRYVLLHFTKSVVGLNNRKMKYTILFRDHAKYLNTLEQAHFIFYYVRMSVNSFSKN